MRENNVTVVGVMCPKWSPDMAGLIVAQIDRDGARPRIFYWRESDHDGELMANAIAARMNGNATMIPRGDMLDEVQFCHLDVAANHGNFAIVGSFFDGVVPHLRHIGPKKGRAFNNLAAITDGGEVQVITLTLPKTKSHGCPMAKCSTVRSADDLVIGEVLRRRRKAA